MKLQNPAKVTHVKTLSYISAEHENELAACLKSMERKRIPDTEWIDEVFDTEFLQANHERRGKRSSILKQAKIPNLDICDDEYDVRYGRKSQNLKRRVSFADTFQVKELNTGNIYDIPGRNAVESSKDSSFSIHFPNFNSDKEDKENVDINSFRIAMTETHQSMNQIIVQREIMAEDMSLSESVIVSEDLDKLPLNSTTLPNGLNKQTDFYGEQDMNLTLLPGNNLHHSELKNNIEENQYPTCTIVTSVSCMAHTFHCPDSKHNCLLQGRSHITQIEVPAVDDHLYLESIPIYSNDPDKENIYQKKLSAIASAQQGQKKSFRVVSDDVNNLNTKSQKALKPIFISENTIRPSEKATFTPKCLMSAGQTQLDVEDMDLTCDVTSITSTQIKSLTDRQTYGTTNKGASREGSKTMHFQSNNMDLTCLSVKSKKSLDLTGFDKLNLDTVSNEMDITCNFGSISRMDFQPGNPLTKPSIAKFLDHGESTVPYSPTLPIHSKNMEFSCIVPYESSDPSVNDFYVSRDSKVSPSDSIINTQQTNDTSGNKKSLIDISSNKQAYHFSQLFSGRENHDHTQRKSCTMDETICSPRVTKDLSILNKKNLSDANDEILNILSGVEHSIHKENDCLVGTLPPSASSSKISFAEEILQVSNNSLKRQLLTTEQGNLSTKPTITVFHDYGENTVPYSPTSPIISKSMEFTCMIPYKSRNPSVNGSEVSRSDSILNTQRTNDASGSKKGLMDISSNEQAYHFSQLFSDKENYNRTQRKSCAMDETIYSPRVTKDLSILNKKNLSYVNDGILNIQSGVEHSILKENDCLVGTLPPSASSSKISFAEEILQVSNNSLEQPLLTTEPGNLLTKSTITEIHDYDENTVPYSQALNYDRTQRKSCAMDETICSPRVTESYDRSQRKSSAMDETICPPRVTENYDCTQRKSCAMDETICPGVTENNDRTQRKSCTMDETICSPRVTENYDRPQRESCDMEETICIPSVTKNLSILNEKNLSFPNDEILNIQSGVEHSILKENGRLVGTLPPSASSSNINSAEEILQVSNNSLKRSLLTTEQGNLSTKPTITEFHDYGENTVPYSPTLPINFKSMEFTCMVPYESRNHSVNDSEVSRSDSILNTQQTNDISGNKKSLMDISSNKLAYHFSQLFSDKENYNRTQRKSCAMDETIYPPRVAENYDRTQRKSCSMDETICSPRATKNLSILNKKNLSYVNDEILNIQSGVEHSIHKENDCLVGTLPPSASSSKISSAEEILQVSNNSLEQPLLTTEPGNLLTKLTITEFHDYDENTIPYSQTLPLHSKNMEFTCVNPSESSAPSVNDSDTYKDEIIFHEQTKNKDGETSKMSEKPESVYILPSSTTSTKTSSSNQLLKDSKNSLKRPLPSTPGIVYSIRNIKKHKVGHDDKKSDTENQDLGYSLKTLKHHELKVGIQSETNISAPLTVNNNSNMISLPTFIKHCVTPSENEQINNHITPLATIFSELPSSIFQNMSFKEFDVSSPRHQKKNDKSSVEEVNHSVTSNRCSLRRSSIKEKISNSYLMCSSSELKEIDVTAPSQPSLPEKSMDLDLDVPKSALLESSLVNPKNVSAQIEPSLLEKEIDLDIPKSSFWLESSSVNLKKIDGAVPPQPSLLEKEMDLDVPKSSVLLESSTLNMKNVTVPPQSSLLEKEMDLDVTKSSVLLESALVNPKSITPLPESSLHEKEIDLDVPKSSVLLESSNNIVESITSQPEPSLQEKEMDLDVPKSSVLLEPSTENVKNVTVPLRPSLLEKEMDVDVPKSSVFHESSTINMKSATVPPQPSLLEEEMDLNVPKSSVLLESSLVNLKTVSSHPEPSLQEEEMDLDVPKSSVLLESSTENAKTVTVSDVKLKHTFCEAVTSELPEITLSFESSMTGLKGATSEAQNIEQNFQAEVVFSSDVSQRTPLNEKMLHSSAFRLLHSETSITTDIYSMEQASSTVANSDLTDGAIITKVSVKTITNTTAEMKVELESPDKSEMEFEKMAAPQKSSAVACTKEELPNSSCPSNCPNVPESETSSTSPVNSTEAVEKKPTKIDNALTLKKFKEILEQESSGEKCKWKLKTLKQNQAVFELSWGCRVGFLRYTCTLFLHIQQTSPNESSVEFRRGEDDDFDTITELGYKAFHHLVREKSIMHPVCSKQTLLKLSEYSAIALKVETLMRDLLKLFFSRYTYNISEGVNPLKIHIDVENKRQRSKCIVTCLVDLSSYPNIKIVPQIKHQYFDDLTDEIQRAVALVEPGKNYIWNITLAAHSV
nr:uncharacterized protein LOC107438072 isoform X1 [Parasteatoda tepidariorum]